MTQIDKLIVTITRTSDGSRVYMQIVSVDMVAVNIVLIADEIAVQDMREDDDTKEVADGQ